MYPACVKLYAYDTLTRQQAGAPFSGVVVTKSGFILTVAHTTTPGTTYKVNFPDGTITIAKALGNIMLASSPMLPDVALMKTTCPGNWPFAEMGDSENIKADQPCISLSYPESLAQEFPSVRYGRITLPRNEQGMIQSTCMMEPGDSGGPLFDLNGKVIGLHSAIDVSESKNFDVPVQLYRKYWTALNEIKTYTALPSENDETVDHKYPLANRLDFESTVSAMVARKASLATVTIESRSNATKYSVKGMVLKANHLRAKSSTGIFIISKSSQVQGTPNILLQNGTTKSGKIIARDVLNDLVLLRFYGRIKGGISISEIRNATKFTIDPGRFVFSMMVPDTSARGIISTKCFTLPKIASLPFLGAFVPINGDMFAIDKIIDNSPASLSGLMKGDVINSIAGRWIRQREDFGHILSEFWPGDTVVFNIRRNNKEMNLSVVLGVWPLRISTHPAEHFAGGKSIRRDGFHKIFIHDLVLKPSEVGGPLFDCYGRLQGVNIARYSRTASIALPPSVVLDFLMTVLPVK